MADRKKILTREYQLPIHRAQLEDAAIAKGMAGSGKYCGIFEDVTTEHKKRSFDRFLAATAAGAKSSKLFPWE